MTTADEGIKTITISESLTKVPQKSNKQLQLTGEELRKKLEGYLPVSDIELIPINTHMRYFTKNAQGKWIFKLGGFLKKREETFIYLSNGPAFKGSGIWKVSKDNSKFYYKPKAINPDGKPKNRTTPVKAQSQAQGNTQYKINQVSNSDIVGGAQAQAQAQAQANEITQELNAIKEVNRQYRFALEQQQNQIQQLRRQLAQQ